MKANFLSFLLFLSFGLAAQQSPDCQVKKITIYSNILLRGGNPAYKPSGDTIVYQKNILNWSNLVLSTDIYISDTSMGYSRCLTCDTNVLPAAIRHDKHKGNAEYHPSGDYILFTSENENGVHQPWNLPGAGVSHDIFIMNNTGTQFWRMTNVPNGSGILHPAFSHDGTKLFWAELYYSTLTPQQGEEYGLWNLKMADFSIVAGVPQISNVVTFAPRDSVWYESHAFSPDDRYIIFTSHQEDSSALYGDITYMDTADIGTSNFINLTNTPYIHDEHAHWSPDGNKISWMSGTYTGQVESYNTELYLMDANGANQTRITHFTDSTYPEYIQDTVVVADHYWSPDGTRIFGFVHFVNASGWPSELYQVEFMGPCGMNPTSVSPIHTPTDSINVYPDPAGTILNVTLPGMTNTQANFTITNALGQVVYESLETFANGMISVNVSALPEGVYFLHIVDESSCITKPFVVSR